MSQNIYVNIDPSGAERGAARTINALNSIIQYTQNVNIQINNMGRNTDNSTRRMSNSITRLQKDFNALKVTLAALIPLNMFEALISKIIAVDKSYQAFSASMYAATNDMKESKKAFEFVSNVTRAYGVDLENVSKSYAKFRAAVATLIPTAAADKLFIALTEVSSVLHMAPENVNRMFTAFTQIASKGQVYAEELKQQLGEHLPGTMALAASAMGMTVRELMDTMKKGEVDIKKFFLNMPDVIHEKFSEAAKIASQSITAQVNNLKSTIFRNFVELNASGATVGISKLLQAIDNKLQPTTEHFKAFGQVIGAAALQAAEFVNNLTPEQVAEFATQVVNVFKAFIELVKILSSATSLLVTHSAEVVLAIQMYITFKIALLAYSGAMVGAAAATGLAAGALRLLGRTVAIVAAVIAGWQIGTHLREKYLAVELFGIALAKNIHKIMVTVASAAKTIVHMGVLAIKKLAEGGINSLASLAESAMNLIPGLNIVVSRVDFGSKETEKKLHSEVASYNKIISGIDSIYDSGADHAIADRIGKAGQIEAEVAKTKTQIEELNKINGEYERLSKEAEEMFGHDKYKDFGASASDKKAAKDAAKAAKDAAKAAKEADMAQLQLVKENVSNMKSVYRDKQAVLDEIHKNLEIGDADHYRRSVDLVKLYTSEVVREYSKLNSAKTLSEKQRADIAGEIANAQRDEASKLKSLQRDILASSEKFESDLLKLEQDSGMRRIDYLRDFNEKWVKENKDLIDKATANGDTSALDRIQKVKEYGEALASLTVNDDVGATKFKVASEAMKQYGDVLKGTTFEIDAMHDSYNAQFEALFDLYEKGKISDLEASKVHMNLMQQRVNAVKALRLEMLSLNLELGNASWAETMELAFLKVTEGFVNLETSFKQLSVTITETLTNGLGDVFLNLIDGSKSFTESMADLGRTILSEVVNAIIKMGVQWLITQALGKATSDAAAAATVATATATGTAITAAMTPAAIMTSLATMGANSTAAIAGILSTTAAAQAVNLSSMFAGAFDQGGYIPDGKFGIVGEYGPELISGPVAVTGREKTADLLGNQSANSPVGDTNIIVQNTVSDVATVETSKSMDGSTLIQIIRREASNIAKAETRKSFTNLKNNNSFESQQITKHLAVRPKK